MQRGTHKLPKPNASPEQGSPATEIFATILFARGSISWTVFGSDVATHTERSETAIQSAWPPTLNVLVAFKLEKGTWTSLIPGLVARNGFGD